MLVLKRVWLVWMLFREFDINVFCLKFSTFRIGSE